MRVTDPFELEPADDLFRGSMRPWFARAGEGAPPIRLDLSESDADYTIKADVPGVRKEDIDVRADGNRVTISAEIKKEAEKKEDGRVLRSERRYGFASGGLSLGCDVDEAKAAAHYKDGVLELKLPKKSTPSSKRLAIG